MSFWWLWPTRWPGSSGRYSAEAKHFGPKLARPHNERWGELYCEDDDDLMAKQGDRDRPNPRHCPSFELANVMGRRSSDSIRARGKDYAASRGRIDDRKPSPSQIIKTTCNQGGVHRCQCHLIRLTSNFSYTISENGVKPTRHGIERSLERSKNLRCVEQATTADPRYHDVGNPLTRLLFDCGD